MVKDFNIFMGFDGFVDKILKPVRQKSEQETIPFQTMKEFSVYIGEKSGKSCSIDLEILHEKIGGNMPIAANALGNLGCRTVCVGALGIPDIDPVFREMNSNCELISVSNPGYCSSLEFEDGKLMLATNTHMDHLDYEKLVSRVTQEQLTEYLNGCDAVAFLNWGELLHSNDIWENILYQVMPGCEFTQKKIMLVDFSDFSKRDSEEVERMLELLKGYAAYFDITVSLNENELELFLEKLKQRPEQGLTDREIVMLAERFCCRHFVIHLLDCSKYVEPGTVYTVNKEVIEEPKIITGGGDHFNAGLLYGLLLGRDLDEAIRLGSGLSCLYVRDAQETGFEELMDYRLRQDV